jgi:hypothetical protein
VTGLVRLVVEESAVMTVCPGHGCLRGAAILSNTPKALFRQVFRDSRSVAAGRPPRPGNAGVWLMPALPEPAAETLDSG